MRVMKTLKEVRGRRAIHQITWENDSESLWEVECFGGGGEGGGGEKDERKKESKSTHSIPVGCEL